MTYKYTNVTDSDIYIMQGTRATCVKSGGSIVSATPISVNGIEKEYKQEVVQPTPKRKVAKKRGRPRKNKAKKAEELVDITEAKSTSSKE